ncbi:hypothetical protein D9M69_677330 [compost metagenome]
MLPVKVSFRTRLSSNITLEMGTGSLAVNTWNVPSGPPACSQYLTRSKAVRGDCSAGLRMTVQPAANAGAAFRVAIAAGKFQGVMAYTGPTG